MSESPVISYLHYLQEVSRKILLRSGFENVLYRKSKKQNPCYFDFKKIDHLQEYLLRVRAVLQRDFTRGLYIGFGLFVGRLTRNQRNRSVAAPLFFCSVDLDSDSKPNTVSPEIRWSSITLNYDLITLILEQEIDRQDEELELPPIDNVIAPEKLKLLSEIEDEFERKVETESYQKQLLSGEKLTSFVDAMKRQISDFDSVGMANTEFDFKEIGALVDNRESLFSDGRLKGLTFFPHIFFFAAPVPEQLATYIALREMIRQIKN